MELKPNLSVSQVRFQDLCGICSRGPRCVTNKHDVCPLLSDTASNMLVNVECPTFRSLGWQGCLKIGNDVKQSLGTRKICSIPLRLFRRNPLDPNCTPAGNRNQAIFSDDRIGRLDSVTIYGFSDTWIHEVVDDPSRDFAATLVSPASVAYDFGLESIDVLSPPEGTDNFAMDFCCVPRLVVSELVNLDLKQLATVDEFLGRVIHLCPVNAYDFDFLMGDPEFLGYQCWRFPQNLITTPEELKTALTDMLLNVQSSQRSPDWIALSVRGKLLRGLPGVADEESITVFIGLNESCPLILIHRSHLV
eukprot:Gregarina_sp_Poly_1__8595@NODE_50_length_17596_cov_118_903303_g43_i0_p5_GENE_NODE_50_length_17596_cov_118_903303_g43_i0NODE_50_length_17596_cov_118_903303_g43_i0_p5_ORF_typecomplete_len305_score34_15_NODE_50_length_17596_cov_118_903303_g43_i01244013354